MTGRWATFRVLAVAVVLLLAAGSLHRWVHLARASASSTYRPPHLPLSQLPSGFGTFELLRDLPLTSEILQVAAVDTYVHREYASPGAEAPLQLYVGYWGYQNKGMGHGPEVCFPAVGWQPVGEPKHRVMQFSGAGAPSSEVEITLHHFSLMQPEGIKRVAVGFVAVVNGQFRASSRDTFLHHPPRGSQVGFLAHIEATTAVPYGRWDGADSRIEAFMEAILPDISTCLFGPPQEAVHPGPVKQEGTNT